MPRRNWRLSRSTTNGLRNDTKELYQPFLNNDSSLSLVPESAAPEEFPDCLNLKKSQKLERVLSSTLSAWGSRQSLYALTSQKEQLRQQCKPAPQEGHCDCRPTKKSSAISFLHLWQAFMKVKIQAVQGNCQEAFCYIIFFGSYLCRLTLCLD